jgi:hypothetical protein
MYLFKLNTRLIHEKLTAVMLEDHSPPSRNSNRKPFRRKGSKTVLFSNSCIYYQLESTSYDAFDDDQVDEDIEELIMEGQLDGFDQDDQIDLLESGPGDEMNTDTEMDSSHPSPRLSIEADVSGMLLVV